MNYETFEQKFYFIFFFFPSHCTDTKAYGISFNLSNLHQDEPHDCGLFAAAQAAGRKWLRKEWH